MSLRKIYYALPPRFRFLARRLFYFPTDILESFSKKNKLIPPKGMIFTGSGDFEKQGNTLLEYFKEEVHLQPHHAVLDIGSGIGRVAVALTKYLSPKGKYEGFDVIELGVNWCQKNITTRFSNFNFKYIPLKNDLYRNTGADAASFEFPYPADEFDLVVLTSVFTHMLPEEVENYLKEIQRVLKPSGKCFATFFILNEDSKKLMNETKAFYFPHSKGHYSLMDESVKAANVAFEEDFLTTLLTKCNLHIEKKFYGHWSGRAKKESKDFQDILILKKEV